MPICAALCLRLCDAHVGDIHAGHIPSTLRQEDRIPAFAHAEIDRAAGPPIADGLFKQWAWLSPELSLSVAKFLIPVILVLFVCRLTGHQRR